ncbi:unnamed protein product [Linum trigynum]|uniref:CCHC-type domain-containing protein n=1 Tax=Linum trigynum TaxID=586398 RepID=A0AAV2D7S3_9ROSI
MDQAKDLVSSRLNGRNFPLWEFQFRVFVEGKRLFPYLDGSAKKPLASADDKEQADWAANNAQVISWLSAAVEPNIALGLRSFATAHEMWTHIFALHSQQSASCQFEVSNALALLHQGDKDIRTYYQEALHLWTEEDMLSAALLKGAVLQAMMAERQRTQLMNFIMKLHPDFEPIRASLLHRNVTSMDEVLAELLREEIRLHNQAQLDRSSSTPETVFAVGRSGKPQFQRPIPPHVECHYCREKGHVQIHCRRRNYCNYCKTSGHIVLDCPSLARRGKSTGSSPPAPSHGPTPLPAFGVQLPSVFGSSTSVPTPPPLPSGVLGAAPAASPPLLTSEALEQMVQATLQKVLPGALHSVFSVHSNASGKSSLWHLDSAAYNHMSGDRDGFMQLRPSPSIELQVANGACLPVRAIGTVE